MEEKFHIDLRPVGKRMRAARLKLGLTQERVAECTDFTGQYWSLLETGRERGSVCTYLQIAAVLGLTLDDLFYEDAVLQRISREYSKDRLMEGCTQNERIIISETLMSLKSTLQKYRQG